MYNTRWGSFDVRLIRVPTIYPQPYTMKKCTIFNGQVPLETYSIKKRGKPAEIIIRARKWVSISADERRGANVVLKQTI